MTKSMRIKVGGTLSSYNFLLLLLIVNIMFYCPVNSTARKKSICTPTDTIAYSKYLFLLRNV